MKKSLSFIAITCLVGIFSQSCEKESIKHGTNTTQIVNATVDMNKVYQFTINNVTNPESVQIKQQASHYAISQIETTNTSGIIYNYTPSLNYFGADQVTIVVSENGENNPGVDHHGCGNNVCNHHGHCNGHHQENDDMGNTSTYIINLTVNSLAASNKSASSNY